MFELIGFVGDVLHSKPPYERDRTDAAAAIQLEAAIVLSRMIMICLFWQYEPLISCDSEEVITLKSYQWAVHCR